VTSKFNNQYPRRIAAAVSFPQETAAFLSPVSFPSPLWCCWGASCAANPSLIRHPAPLITHPAYRPPDARSDTQPTCRHAPIQAPRSQAARFLIRHPAHGPPDPLISRPIHRLPDSLSRSAPARLLMRHPRELGGRTSPT
jgi:hypothetical protein